MEEIYVNVTKNTRVPGVMKQLKINPKTNFEKILQAAGNKLGIEAKILYNESGAIVDDGNDIKDGETLYVSQGEQYWPKQTTGESIGGMVSPEKTRVLKLGIIGPPSVGKSALTIRYIQKVFIDEYLPSFENLFKKSLVIKDEHVEVDILDSSGMDELVVMRPNWFKEREAFIMVYAVNNKGSFEALNVFYEQLVTFRKDSNVPLLLVGNKCDMESSRIIKKEEGIKLAKAFNAEFYETSAKKDINVSFVFEHLARKLYDIKYGNATKAKSKVNEPEDMKCKCVIV